MLWMTIKVEEKSCGNTLHMPSVVHLIYVTRFLLDRANIARVGLLCVATQATDMTNPFNDHIPE